MSTHEYSRDVSSCFIVAPKRITAVFAFGDPCFVLSDVNASGVKIHFIGKATATQATGLTAGSSRFPTLAFSCACCFRYDNYSRPSNPFLVPLTKYLDRYATETMDYFLEKDRLGKASFAGLLVRARLPRAECRLSKCWCRMKKPCQLFLDILVIPCGSQIRSTPYYFLRISETGCSYSAPCSTFALH